MVCEPYAANKQREVRGVEYNADRSPESRGGSVAPLFGISPLHVQFVTARILTNADVTALLTSLTGVRMVKTNRTGNQSVTDRRSAFERNGGASGDGNDAKCEHGEGTDPAPSSSHLADNARMQT
jgi:hypothetical protein